ncbi:MAG: aminoacetone oxidase family FAD-binding enzyme [Firmicutes bacterium]|nr:aminoacetone oxidase family FAD-binding enzyme [Bacillota bacterium]
MNRKFKIAIAGGGAAGLMAAAAASSAGAEVILIEKMPAAGKKLLLTGNGRCNITNISMLKPDLRKIYGENGIFLSSSIKELPYEKLLAFFEDNGVPLKQEKDGRIFPKSDKSSDILDMFLDILRRNRVEILTETALKAIETEPGKPGRVRAFITDMGAFEASQYIIACGGKSFPATGSTGDSFLFAEQTGHRIEKLHPALVPVKVKETWLKKLQGLTLDYVGIEVLQKGKILFRTGGSLLFTHFGISGPEILNLSGSISALDPSDEITIRLNFVNQYKDQDIKEYMGNLLASNTKKSVLNMLKSILPERAAAISVELSGIDPGKKSAVITKQERKALSDALTGIKLTYNGTTGFAGAMLTGGGIDPSQLNPGTMRSGFIDNLAFAGEALAIDGPTGGYNLHMCWLTGFMAGKSAAGEI